MSEETLFHKVLAVSVSERAAFLDAACVGKPELRAAVEALLAAHDDAGNWLDRPVAGVGLSIHSYHEQAPNSDTGADTPLPGNLPMSAAAATDFRLQIDAGVVIANRYTLQERIGEGGMGEVWVAKQTEPVKRRVALKLIKTGMDSKAVLARFEHERQALAMMDHPNIASVFDGGMTPTGQPFFAMELVNGLSLTKFCDAAKLTPSERLELFIPICHAVQHAHQKGIVHRDLKPANILVTMIDGRPVPKVIDFGVAKATAGKLTEESLSTHFGAVVGTLEYMAPEQAGYSGDDIDTRADIYSLGVILYELLIGLRPFEAARLQKAAYTEMIRIVREEEPSKPSTRLSTNESLPSLAALRQTEPKKLMAMLRGELDWVVMKCLEKQRHLRYETADGLARDIERFLDDEPVEARPPSIGYRFRKFLRRNRTSTVTAGLVLLTLILGIVGTTYGMLHAENRRIEAESAKEREAEQRAKVEKARDYAREALDAMTSSVTGDFLITQTGISEEQKRFLTQVLTYYKEFAGETANDERSRARTASAALRVGLIEQRIGRLVESEAAYRLARDRFIELVAEFPNNDDYRSNLARSRWNLALQLAHVGKRPEAVEQHQEAILLQEKLVAESPTKVSYRDNLAASHNSLGMVLRDLGKWPEAEEHYRKALALQEKLSADAPRAPRYRHDLARTHNNLGLLLTDLGNYKEVAKQYEKALVIREKLVAEFPNVADYRRNLASTHNNIAILLNHLDQRKLAEEQYRKALVLKEQLAAEFPGMPEYRQDLALSYNNLGGLLREWNKAPEAEQLYRKALSIRAALAAESPTVPEYRDYQATTHRSLAALLTDLGQFQDAEQHAREALSIREKLVADFPSIPSYRENQAASHNILATVLTKLGKRPQAEGQYRKAVDIRDKLVAEFPAILGYRKAQGASHYDLGLVLKNLGKRPEAEQEFRKALTIREKLASEFPTIAVYQIDLCASYLSFGNLFVSDTDPSKSLVWLDRSIGLLTNLRERNQLPDIALKLLSISHVNRARAYDRLKRYEEATRDWDKVVEFCSKDERRGFRLERAMSRANAGQAAAAVAEVDELAKSSDWSPVQKYDFACVYGIAAGKVSDKREAYSVHAVELLRKAMVAGYKEVAHIRKDPDLDSVRDREDFKALLKEMENKSAAKPEKQP